LHRDENDSPRGRIDLIRAMLEKGGRPNAKTVHHLDRCLSCLSCMTTCAVKVDYAHLIDIGRAYIETNYRRPVSERALRWLLASVLPYPRRFAAALFLARMAGPIAGLLPSRLRNLITLAQDQKSPGEVLRATVLAPTGAKRRRVALLPGCAQQALNRNINAATIRILQRHGCEVIIAPGIACCGALPLHMGRSEQARALAAANVAALAADLKNLDAVIVNASGCGTTVKDYGHLLGNDNARRFAALTRDITEFLAALDLPQGNAKPYRVAYHDACSLQHGQRIASVPRQLLSRAGFNVIEVPERHFCCGSAGTYNLLQPEIAATLGERKAAHIGSVDPDIVAAGNLGCMVQIGRYTNLPVVHTVELLDWATGGLEPPVLSRCKLRAPVDEPSAVAPGIAVPSSPVDSNATAIW
jgi:glycolate oxidase iron-sulfur subunit